MDISASGTRLDSHSRSWRPQTHSHPFCHHQPLGYGCSQCPRSGRSHGCAPTRIHQTDPSTTQPHELTWTANHRRRKRSISHSIPRHADPASSFLGMLPSDHSPGRISHHWQPLTLNSTTASLSPRTGCLTLRLSSTLPCRQRLLVPFIYGLSKALRIPLAPETFMAFGLVAPVFAFHSDVSVLGHFLIGTWQTVPSRPVRIAVRAPTTPLPGSLQPIGIQERNPWPRQMRHLSISMDSIQILCPRASQSSSFDFLSVSGGFLGLFQHHGLRLPVPCGPLVTYIRITFPELWFSHSLLLALFTQTLIAQGPHSHVERHESLFSTAHYSGEGPGPPSRPCHCDGAQS